MAVSNSDKQTAVTADLLLELGCEELPPKTLPVLAESFYRGFVSQLEKAGLEFDAKSSRYFYTPRRLALLLRQVASRQPHQVLERKGPAIAAAFDADNRPTAAAVGFARSVGKKVDELETLKLDKGEWLFSRVEKTGEALEDLLFPMVEKALSSLPVAKPMRWASNEFSFVRPVHWLVALYGENIVNGELFGLKAGNTTRGHRIHNPGPHIIDFAENYEQVLESACVLADQKKRKSMIEQQAISAGEATGGKTLIDANLLDEVSNLVEWPRTVLGSFDVEFLDVPAEALIASMQDHQKFFPLVSKADSSLLAQFITVANLESKDFGAVREGFERVIRPRLADARFFWDQDNKSSIEDWLPLLDSIVFQNKLGSIGDKSRRIAAISKRIAEVTCVNVDASQRAALLCKCDLVSHMVGEFPELQGTMGRYYAQKSGESATVAQAIGDHYLPAFSGDRLPANSVGKVVAMADRLDSLAGIFATGLKPSGNKDPFALRRAALGLIRILLDGELDIELDRALSFAALVVQEQIPLSPETLAELRHFVLERLKHYLCDQGYSTKLVNAVMDAPLNTLPDLASRLDALKAFMALEGSTSLAAANKRIGNILRKSNYTSDSTIDDNLLVIDEERYLFKEINDISERLENLYEQRDYEAGLGLLVGLSASIEAFFNEVMVMDEDTLIRNNRLSLLSKLKGMFDRVANLALIG